MLATSTTKLSELPIYGSERLGLMRPNVLGEIVVRRIGEYLEIDFESEHATPVQIWGDDLQGQRVITERTIAGDPGKGKIRIDIGDLPSGVYFITVQQGKEQKTEGVQIVR